MLFRSDKAVTGDKDIKEDISTLISGIDEKLAIADITDKDDLGLRKNDLEEALKQV